MHDELVVVHRGGKPADSCVIQRRLYLGDGVSLRIVPLDRITVGAVHAEVDDRVHGKWCLVAGNPRTEEVLDAGVGRHYLVVIGRGGGEPCKHNSIRVRPRSWVCGGRRRAGLQA